MIKKLARWILKDDLKLADEYATAQVKKIVFNFEMKIKQLQEQHKKELMLLTEKLAKLENE